MDDSLITMPSEDTLIIDEMKKIKKVYQVPESIEPREKLIFIKTEY